MHSADGRYVGVFNGEIYNYREIRKELEQENVVFRTESDTEVLIECFARLGPKALDKFTGMFAFAIWDRETETLFVARDRFGIKPLYYHDNANYMIFASEMKAIIPLLTELKPRDEAVYDYLAYGRVDHLDETFFQGIKRFPAAHYGQLSTDSFTIARWYDLDEEICKLQKDPEFTERTCSEHIAAIRKLFFDAVRLRLRSDVPVGSCLSGGIDSSSIVSVATSFLPNAEKNNFETYSVVFGRWYNLDESVYIDIVTRKFDIKKNLTTPTTADWVEKSSGFIYHQEEPLTGASPFSQYCLMSLAHSNRAKVLLDGQGGDEILAGYEYMTGYGLAEAFLERHLTVFFKELFYAVKRKRFFALKVFLYQFAPRFLQRRINFVNRHLLEKKFVKRFKRRQVVEPLLYLATNLNRALVNHINYKLQHLLKWEDKNSMAFSIETRVPFLDHNFVCYTLSLPPSYKVQNGKTKWVLRRALKDVLPKEISERTDKIGFATPEEFWLNESSQSLFRSLKASPHPLLSNYIDIESLRSYLNRNAGRFSTNASRHLFRIICLDLWLKAFFGESPTPPKYS